MALFRSPPLIKPLLRSISISCKKLNVRESDMSFLKFFIELIVAFWVPRTLVPKSTIVVIWYSLEGITVISLPLFESLYEIISLTTNSFLFSSRSFFPTDSIASTKNFEEPSIIGGSDASSSIFTLSISKPTRAAKTCSVVWIFTLFLFRHVPLSVLKTYLIFASMTGWSLRSILVNVYPLSASAGLKVKLTSLPVCIPTPVKDIDFFIVVWFSLVVTIIFSFLDFEYPLHIYLNS